MSEEQTDEETREANERTAETRELTRALIVAGVDAFKLAPNAIPLDLMVAYVYALASTVVAFEGVRPGVDLVAALVETFTYATTELRKAEARDDIESVRYAMARGARSASGGIVCARCGAVNDMSAELARGRAQGETFAICAVCCQWYRLNGDGTWTPFSFEDFEDVMTRAKFERLTRAVAGGFVPRGPRH